MSSPPLISIPFGLDGDAYALEVRELSPRRVELVHVFRYTSNQNMQPHEERIQDVAQSTRREIVRVINKHFPGRTIIVS